jgi:hypothetical protein
LRLRFKIKMNKKRALHLQLKNRIMLPWSKKDISVAKR